MGVAAYKTVELDDYLGGGPQHREVQDNESKPFLSLFKSGIEYLSGGVASGFKHVEKDKFETRLLHCKGKRNVRVRQVPLAVSSLNQGDVFILDAGLTLYQFNGTESSRQEKAKGVEVVKRIRDNERGGKGEIIIVDGNSEPPKAFWDLMGGKAPIPDASKGGDDEGYERTALASTKLFRLTESGSKVEQVQASPLTQNLLESKHCYIIDCQSEIYVWVGKGASAQEKKESVMVASNFLTQNNYPKTTPITRVIEEGETPLFKEKFSNWVTKEKPSAASQPKIANVKQEKVDVKSLHTKKAGPSDDSMVDDGKGKIEIWRIEDLKPSPVPKDLYGLFYGGDSYIIKYTYIKGGKECYIIYFWQGNQSSQDEKAASAIFTIKFDDELGGAATQVRVVQGKEPNHFLTLFKGNLIIASGGKASGFKNKNDADSYNASGTSLYHVRGTSKLNTRAVEVETKATSLNSNDSFVVLTPQNMYIWYGKGSNDGERADAKEIANILKGKRDIKEINEGSEPSDFWTAIGGKQDYASSPAMFDDTHEPRLFQCSNASGAFRVEEIFNFTQSDLDDDDVFILDTFNEVYVWVGSGSNEIEKKMAMESAVSFVETATDGRSKDTPILRINAGFEPRLFTAFFQAWDSSKRDNYERQLKSS